MTVIAGFLRRTPAREDEPPPAAFAARMCAAAAPGAGIAAFAHEGVAVACAPAGPGISWSPDGTVGVILDGDDRDHAAVELASAWAGTGAAALAKVAAPFRSVVIDRRRREVVVCNDPHGLGRVFIHGTEDHLFFATSVRALLAILPATRRFDPQGLAEYLAVGCALQDRTLYAGIRALPPGAAWSLTPEGEVRPARHFTPENWESLEPLPPDEYNLRLFEAFAPALERCLGDGADTALSLTGGLDSRAVLAWIPEGGLPCYTFGGPLRDCADVTIARRLATTRGCPHTTLRVEADFFADFPRLAADAIVASDGELDVSGAVEVHVNRAARAIAGRRLTGNYGSEILRGHVALRPQALDAGLLQPEYRRLAASGLANLAREMASHPHTFIAFKQVPWCHRARLAVEKSELNPRTPFLDPALVKLAYQVPDGRRRSADPLLRLIALRAPALAAIPTDRGLRHPPRPLLTPLASLWRETTARAEYLWDYGLPRWLAPVERGLRHLHPERLFLGRHKFAHFRLWYREPLAPAVRELLEGYDAPAFEPGATARIVADHLSGRSNRTRELHQLLSLRLIESQLLNTHR
jgi:asparagine synthase (glutamine-hydrolysing)